MERDRIETGGNESHYRLNKEDMYTTKKNVLQTVALLKMHHIDKIVISPGSRNTPLIESFYNDSFFSCHICLDERNAGFYALGLIQYYNTPVVICCTSGTALLNYAPAVAEAYYQSLPLVVLSADRSSAWIGQMDGQTIIQNDTLKNFAKKSVQLPEVKDEVDEWHCNRLLNDAFLSCTAAQQGPVHINIPISEPLFDFSEKTLPKVRAIKSIETKKSIPNINYLLKLWNKSSKRMVILGQGNYSDTLYKALEKIVSNSDCVVLSEYLSNQNSKSFIHNFDSVIHFLSAEEKPHYTPDLLITAGGHIISKRLKRFLRQEGINEHWHISESTDIIDLFQSLSCTINISSEDFFDELHKAIATEDNQTYSTTWMNRSRTIPEPPLLYGDIGVVGRFVKKLPQSSVLHLANSSVVRSAQLFDLDPSIKVFCNRGTNGIESTLPTAIGFASVAEQPVYLAIGDLSFFYAVGSLWNISHIKNLRILLINNQCGGIFHLLPNSNYSSLKEYVSAAHCTTAKEWVKASGIRYYRANNEEEYIKNLEIFFDETIEESILLEVMTDMQKNKEEYQTYYNSILNLNNK